MNPNFSPLPITKEDIASQRVMTLEASAIEAYRQWSRKDFGRMDIHRLQKEITQEVFGKPTFTWQGEFHFHVYALSYKGLEFLLYSDGKKAGKGSSIEFVIHDPKDWTGSSIKNAELIPQLLDELLELAPKRCRAIAEKAQTAR